MNLPELGFFQHLEGILMPDGELGNSILKDLFNLEITF